MFLDQGVEPMTGEVIGPASLFGNEIAEQEEYSKGKRSKMKGTFWKCPEWCKPVRGRDLKNKGSEKDTQRVWDVRPIMVRIPRMTKVINQ